MKASPLSIFGAVQAGPPRVFFSAHRYVQGPGVLKSLGSYLAMFGSSKPALLLPPELPSFISEDVKAGLKAAGLEVMVVPFGGQCSLEEAGRHVETLRQAEADALIVAGGGKAIDTAKAASHRLDIPLVVCPTIASTDAPCSSVSVVYTPDGVFETVEFYNSNPDLVVVDTSVIAKAPFRFLAAGMADALATGYEARTCVRNPEARTMVGGRPSVAAATIAERCSETIFRDAAAAAEAAKSGVPNEAFENIVEANTLLSGTGFESGGLAGTHAVATALTVIPSVEHSFLHGEMVSVGILIHLLLEDDISEFQRALKLLKSLGLPVSFGAIGLDPRERADDVRKVVDAALNIEFMKNQPGPVTAEQLHAAVLRLEEEITLPAPA